MALARRRVTLTTDNTNNVCFATFYINGLYMPNVETQEERVQREAREAQLYAAITRAEELLKVRLGWYRYKLFQITGKLWRKSTLWPGVFYIVQRNNKVQVIERGRVKTDLCVLNDHFEPEADRLMTILDLLETDETKLWEMANVLPRGPLT